VPEPALRCVVIGGGVVGSSVAHRLAELGAAVTLVDAGGRRQGASARSFAWVNASSKRPFAYFRLNRLGMEAHRRLAGPWWTPSGHLEWAADAVREGELLAEAEELAGWGYPVEVLTPSEAARREPALTIRRGVEAVVVHPEEGYVSTPRYLEGMRGLAGSLGTRFVDGVAVEEVLRGGGRVTGVRLEDGTALEADRVVVCAGRWTEELMAPLGVRVPLVPAGQAGSPALGLLVRTTPVGASLGRVVHAGPLAVRPDGDGSFLLHSTDTDRRLGPDTPEEAGHPLAVQLLEQATSVLPALQEARIESVRLGRRVLPEDGHSIVGWAPGTAGLYVVATHSGVTMAPALGELVAGEVAKGEVAGALEPFRPDRFTGG
ncbi:MAG: FAD-binding oxidoreductase, partial [Candidatus Dormibacteraeota bacterium]|nr:FAD-binding oxidoreductase [Candidatus Dormibacteraeota bacterium]